MTKYVVQIKSNWANDQFRTVDYFDTKAAADEKAAELRKQNTGDIKTDNAVRVIRKSLSMSDMEAAADNS